ncbi:MAG: aldehyde dehydrogenase family protein [Pseudomonadota bacterium]
MTVKETFDTMDYGPAPESAAEALAWIVDQGAKFGHYINGAFTAPGRTFETKNPSTGKVLAQVTQASQADVDAAVKAARKAQPAWEQSGGPARARVLYAIARLLQKHSRLFAVLETLDNGKPIRESRDIDLPLAQRHFYYHAGEAQLMDTRMAGREALGVCGQIIPWNFPLLMLAWKIAPALAMGNAVVLKPAEWTSLTALLFADICRQAGLPKGVVNIVTGDGAVGEMLVAADVDKIAFTGSTSVGRAIREATAGTGKALTLELGGKSPYIVFDDADIDSAVEGLVDAIWFNQGQVCCAGARLLVHEPIAQDFHNRLKHRMADLRIGDPLDKCIDIGALIDPSHKAQVAKMVSQSSGEIFQTSCPEGCYYPPTLITDLAPADPLMQEEIFGPVLVSTTFRTPAEAVSLANNTRYGLAASVWSENVNLALDVAPKLVSGIVWINGTNMMDAAAGFGGVRESGFGREGGLEGLTAYTKAIESNSKTLKPVKAFAPKAGANNPHPSGLDRTAKLYIGGKQARPDSGYSQEIYAKDGTLIGQASLANRKDLRNAVEAARAATGWSNSTAHLRAQILYYLAENLSARATEIAAQINLLTGKKDGAKEVELCLERLFSAAAWADKFAGDARAVSMRGTALAMREPVGVIGIFADDQTPLLGLISALAPALAMGNRVVAVASEPYPLAAWDFVQVLETSDVPAGVVNLLTGKHVELAPHMAGHMDVDAVWSFSSQDLSQVIEATSQSNIKRTWVNNAKARDWSKDHTSEFLDAATEVKTVWIPYGE